MRRVLLLTVVVLPCVLSTLFAVDLHESATNSIDLREGWSVLQDVNDRGEHLGIFRQDWNPYAVGPAISDWQPISRLAHLQLLFGVQPYFGRELRYFNEAPWWYRLQF